MSCQYQHRLPALCTAQAGVCSNCKYEGLEHLCPMAKSTKVDDSIPSIHQMLDVYMKYAHAGVSHKYNVMLTITNDLKELGLDECVKYMELSRQVFKVLIGRLTDPKRQKKLKNHKDGALSDFTVSSHLSAFRALVSPKLEDAYEKEGFVVPSFQIPYYEVKQKPVQEVSDRQARMVDVMMGKWVVSKKQSDINAFIFTFFAKYCGLRAGDICNAKWSIIQHTPVGIVIAYTPHKSITYKCPQGKPVAFRIDNKTYCMIEPFVKGPDEYVIPRMTNRAPHKSVLKDPSRKGIYEGKHTSLVRKINRELGGCGIGVEFPEQKKLHALRKYFSTDLALATSRKEAADACGHSVSVQGKSYLGTLLGKVA